MTSELLERYRAFAIDLDGVLWRGDAALPGAEVGMAALRSTGKPILFLTNNGLYTPTFVADRLRSYGVPASENEVLSSTIVAREWLQLQGVSAASAFILGSRSIAEQLEGVLTAVPINKTIRPDVVLVSRDLDFDFDRLDAASAAVREGALFVALNRDTMMPMEGGLEPGTGAVLAAIEAASGKMATVLGKPELPMMQAAERLLGTSNVLMIGDRPESDIAGARAAGWGAALVLSGVSSAGEMFDPEPDHILASIADLAGASFQ